jgi:hypothetical protein
MKVHQLEQGTEEWFALRKGRLTASSYDKVISAKKVKYAELIKDPRNEAVYVTPRAAKQQEVLDELVDNGAMPTSSLNSSGLAGLVEKGVARVYDEELVSLNIPAAHKHVDNLLADIYYTTDDLVKFAPSWAMERGTRLEEVARIDFEMRTGIDVDEVGFVTNDSFGEHIGCSPDGLIDGGKGGLEIKCPLPATHFKYHREGVLPKEYRAQVHGCMAVTGADYWWFTSFCPNLKDFSLRIYKDDYTESLAAALKQFNELFISRLARAEQLKTQ